MTTLISSDPLSIKEEIFKEIDLKITYTPSGKYSNKTIPVYSILTLIASLVAFMLNAISVALVLTIFNFASGNLWPYIFAISLASLGFMLSGFLVGKIISMGTLKTMNRNLRIFYVFCLIACAISCFVPLIINYLVFDLSCLTYFTSSSINVLVLDLVFRIGGFFVMLLTIWVKFSNTILENPYCEECQKYHIKTTMFLKDNNLLNILKDLKHFKESGHQEIYTSEWKIVPEIMPYAALIIHSCQSSHPSYLKLSWHYEDINPKGKKIKQTKELFSDILDAKSSEIFNNQLVAHQKNQL